MSETNTATTTTEEQKNVPVVHPFSDESWSESTDKPEGTEGSEQQTQQQTQQQKPDEPLKTHLGYDSWETAKADFEELKKLKDKPAVEPYKFADEESEKTFTLWQAGKKEEVFEILDKQRALDKAIKAEINKDTAAGIIKTVMQHKNPTLDNDEVNFLFNQKYSVPPKPVQDSMEEVEDYEKRVAEWDKQVEQVQKGMVIQAKLDKPEIEKLRKELVFPDIQRPEPQKKQPTQEELAEAAKSREGFMKDVNEAVTKFAGFNAAYKNEGVEIPVAYALSNEEKTSVGNLVSKFAESGYDTNVIFGARWTDKDGVIDIPKMISDLARLESFDSVNQKFITEAVNQHHKNYLKAKGQVTIGNGKQGTFTPTDQSEQQKQEAAIWEA